MKPFISSKTHFFLLGFFFCLSTYWCMSFILACLLFVFFRALSFGDQTFTSYFNDKKKSRNHVCMSILDVQWWQWRHHQPKLVDHPLCFHIGFVLSFYFHVGSIKLYEHPYINPMKAPALRKYLNTSFLHYKNTI